MKISDGIQEGDIKCLSCGLPLDWSLSIKDDGTSKMEIAPHACTKGDLLIKRETAHTCKKMAEIMCSEWGRIFGYDHKLFRLLEIVWSRIEQEHDKILRQMQARSLE